MSRKSLKKPADFDTVAKGARPDRRRVGASSASDEPIAGLGMAPAVAERAFELKDGEVSEAIRTPQGFAFITVTGQAGLVRAEARRGQGEGARRGHQEEGDRGGAPEGGGRSARR